MASKIKKWNEAYQNAEIGSASPMLALQENDFLLSHNGGVALDLACGRAGNAIFLAQRGFEVDAVDLSPVVLEKVATYAKEQALTIKCEVRDIEEKGLSEKRYDVITVGYFFNRDLFASIINALKPGGLLFYQTWSQLRCDEAGPNNPDYRLKSGELLQLCDDLHTLVYRENGLQGDVSRGLRNEAMIVAQQVE